MAFRPKGIASGDADRTQSSLQRLQRDGLLDEAPADGAPTPSVAQRFQRAGSDASRSQSPANAGSSPHRQDQSAAPKAPALPTAIKARRLVLEVAAFMSWSADAVAEKEAHANRDPAAVLAEMIKIINEIIRPSRVDTTEAIRTAIAEDPSLVVFAVTSGTDRKVYRLPRSDNGQSILHGATLDRVPSSVTPFAAPSSLFAAPATSDTAKPKP